MITHKNFIIRVPNDVSQRIDSSLIKFGSHSKNYEYAKDSSEGCTKDVGNRYVNFYSITKPSCLICLIEQSNTRWKLINIVPRDISSISIDEYNAIVDSFVKEIRSYFRKNKCRVRTELSKGIITINDILPRQRAQKLLNDYINGSRFLHDQYDIEILQTLICDIDKYSRKDVNTEELKRYLVTNENVPLDMADQCCRTIYEGLKLLEKRKRY